MPFHFVRTPVLVALSVILGAGAGCSRTETEPTPAPVIDSAVAEPSPPLTSALSDALDIDRMLGHLDALQAIADRNLDNRELLTPGFTSSADYVADQLTKAGYSVRREPFMVRLYAVQEASLYLVEPVSLATTFDDIDVPQFSASGTLDNAPIAAVDLVLPPGPENTSTSGCESDDFVAFPKGAVALIQRGTCTFEQKVQNASAAGASAVVVFNEGQPGRTEVLGIELAGAQLTIPVLGASFAVGEALAEATQVDLVIRGEVLEGQEENVIAETAGNLNDVLMVGAHLDSVAAGPGINDNGSGSAFVLEVALTLAALDLDTVRPVRFAWWGAEERGLLGSLAWTQNGTEQFDAEQLAPLLAYLNFDMLASVNGTRGVSDPRFTAEVSPSPLNEEIAEQFARWFDQRDLTWEPTTTFGFSDDFYFAFAGVPTGSLFSGASFIKTQEQAEQFGGEVGVAFDPCYHLACDTRDNTDPVLYEQMARAGAFMVEYLSLRPVGGRRPVAEVSPMPDRVVRPVGCHDHPTTPHTAHRR